MEKQAIPTQGWYVSPTAGSEKHGQHAVVDSATGRDIAIVYDGPAHARLIAAAPAMKEALEKALEEMIASLAVHRMKAREKGLEEPEEYATMTKIRAILSTL